MDVVLFTAEEPLYLPRYLEPLFREHSDALAEVVVAPPATGAAVEVRRQLGMLGPVAFLRFGARFARGKTLDALPGDLGRRLTGRYHAVSSLAADHGITVRRVPDVGVPSFVGHVEAIDPDLLLSVVCPQKLPRVLLDVPDLAINLHGSLLPRYRGRATAFWPLYYGDEETGVTAHLLTEELDAGPIVEQRSFQIEAAETMHDVSLELADVGGTLAVDLLDRFRAVGGDLDADDLDTRPNRTSPEDYHTLPTPGERREFLRRGNAFR